VAVTPRGSAGAFGGAALASGWSCITIKPIGLVTVPVDQLSTTFAALADPTRRAILARLAEGEATVNELAAPFPMSAQAVGKHLRVLERARLIERRRTAQLRPSRLRAVALKDASEWIDSYREFWEAGFDRMDERLRADG
jgi:DNA-binding transcriptional ArsR family regulator